MKHIISILVCGILLPMLIASCNDSKEEREAERCYVPKTIVFSKYGGENIYEVPGGYWYYLSIDGKNYSVTYDNDLDRDGCCEATLDWLTVELDAFSSQIRFIAKPNETGKKRKLLVCWDPIPPQERIHVEQNE